MTQHPLFTFQPPAAIRVGVRHKRQCRCGIIMRIHILLRHVTTPCCYAILLRHLTTPCCYAMLLRHVATPCYYAMLLRHGTTPSCYAILLRHLTTPCCYAMLLRHVATPCYYAILLRHLTTPFFGRRGYGWQKCVDLVLRAFPCDSKLCLRVALVVGCYHAPSYHALRVAM